MKKRNSKFAQVSVFVIVAIVIVGGAVIGYFVMNESSNKKILFSSDANVQAQFDNLKNSIDNCFKDSAKNALDIIGYSGGYFDKPKNYMTFEEDFIPYYYFEGEIIVPTKSQIQTELGKALNDQLLKCFEGVDKKDFTFDYKTPKSNVAIGDKKVDFKVDLPISITKGDKTVVLEMKNYPVSINSELNAMISLGDYYAKSHKTDSKMFCISCIGAMAEKNNMYVDILDINNDTTMVLISENHTAETPYFFEFLNKYKGDEESPGVSAPVPEVS